MMLSVRNLEAGYGKVQVLWSISLDIYDSEIVTLLGPNGAGKTTTLRTITGLLKPSSGEVRFNDTRIDGLAAYRIAGLGISMVPEGREIFPRMSVYENLLMGSETIPNRQKASEAIERVFALFPVLKERMKQAAGTLSGGEQQMLAIGRALVTSPSLLLLDEPSTGLAPKVVVVIFNTLRKLREEGLTMLLVEQNARMALELCDRGYLLENGRVVMQGSRDQMLIDGKIKSSYLGL